MAGPLLVSHTHTRPCCTFNNTAPVVSHSCIDYRSHFLVCNSQTYSDTYTTPVNSWNQGSAVPSFCAFSASNSSSSLLFSSSAACLISRLKEDLARIVGPHLKKTKGRTPKTVAIAARIVVAIAGRTSV